MIVPYCRRGLHGYMLLMGMGAVSPVVLVTEADIVGVPLPFAVRALLAGFGIAIGVFAGIVAFNRYRSSDPALALEGDLLHLYHRAGGRLTLSRAEVQAIGAIEPIPNRVMGLFIGSRAFDILTSRDLRGQDIRVGDRVIDDDLDRIHQVLTTWVDGGSPTADPLS